jgi:hypothetical protein
MNPILPSLPAPPTPPSDDKIWIILCHLSILLGVGLILPLVVYFAKKQDSPLTAAHAKEALNFHISIYVYAIISLFLSFILIGIPLFILLSIGSIVLPIIACVKTSEGQFYRYPLTVRLIN